MFFCISMGFIVAWTPYTVVSFVSIFSEQGAHMAPEGFVFPALFAKSSHIYNPVIYFYFNRAFRQELRALLRSLCPLGKRNRVGVQSVTGNQAQDPIQIQLQERGLFRRSDSQAARGRNSHASSGHRPSGGKVVYPHWVANIRVAPSTFNPMPSREFLPPLSA
ncbi:hypothetical protein AAFF_G00088430 [Aldrovandia affinis]|uniref:G-protein coupled receptors family 1 profile domain-containing protein n=1 Tax=Aldrovandia affinis TaxID=143900 RepID=A0AAD7RYU8_9TELE|nr:hypothetical protein AAFF_G00088430 [Aldrovandia affinis]